MSLLDTFLEVESLPDNAYSNTVMDSRNANLC